MCQKMFSHVAHLLVSFTTGIASQGPILISNKWLFRGCSRSLIVGTSGLTIEPSSRFKSYNLQISYKGSPTSTPGVSQPAKLWKKILKEYLVKILPCSPCQDFSSQSGTRRTRKIWTHSYSYSWCTCSSSWQK
jgi:hypothetical protein